MADYDSADCEVSFKGHDRTLAVGPSNANKCGGELFPWQLKVDAGQRVNVTLVQFAISDVDKDVIHDDDSSALPASSHDVTHDLQYDVADITDNDELPAVAVPNDFLLANCLIYSEAFLEYVILFCR